MIYNIEPRQGNYATSAYWENFLLEDELTQLLNLPEWNEKSLSMVQHPDTPTVRMCEVAWLYHSDETNNIWKKITDTIADVNRDFFRYELTGCYEPAQLSYYSENYKGHYSWHIDIPMQSNCPQRKLSMSLLLNDPSEFEGGELQLLYNNDTPTTLEFKKGRAWFFPSYTIHRVTPVTRGVRKSLVLWVGGPDFK